MKKMDLTVVNDVVGEVIHTLDFRIASFVVNVQVAEKGNPAISLHEPATRMSLQALADDAILNGNVRSIAIDGEGLIAAPTHAQVIEYHIIAVGDSNSILSRSAALAHTDADVAHDGLVGIGEGPAIAVDGDAVARGCLAEDGHVARAYDAVGDVDDTANGKDNDAFAS